ncbi:MAG: ERAP1-like C-terminal domain-containing protein, partial [Demequina sp.]|uniref:ERAP1-like C-terminal domain-containing protein n=1 Tax=Demequina sp. TaxID=2050685 RepID=UPI003A8699F3
MRWWDDLWLKESFADFMGSHANVATGAHPDAWVSFASRRKGWAYEQDQLPTTHPIVADIPDLEAAKLNFDGITYAKGASVLRQLAAWVGEDQFFAGVAEYFRKHHHSNTTLKDLLVELEETSGRDLSGWSQVWLEKAGITTLRPAIEVDSNDDIAAFAVLQEVPAEWPTQRPHRLGIGGYDVVVDDTGVTRLERSMYVEIDVSGERTDVSELVGKHRPALLLINDGDLAYAKVRLDEQSLATAVEHVGSFADPLARSMVLTAAWDMTRDGEMPARQYIDLVLKNIGRESESTTIMVLLRQLATALALYVHPVHEGDAAQHVAEQLWKLAIEAEPGSDSQLQFVRAFAAHAQSELHLDNLQGLIDEKLHLEGLEIDKDLQWDLLIGLVAGGRAGEVAIELQLAKDGSASGQRRAAHATAAIPTVEGKRAAWDSLVNAEKDLPNALQFEATAGFGHVHDTALLEPYVDEYFASVRRIYADKTNEMATNLIEGLYPAELAGRVADLQDKADAWLAENADAHDALKRLIIEGRDGVRRALKNQERDY